MDFWVFVAAAGAGCIAKRLQNASTDRCSTSKLSAGVSSSRATRSYQINGLARRNKIDKDTSEEEENPLNNEEVFDMTPPLFNVPFADEASNSRDDREANVRNSTDEVDADKETNAETGYDICNSLDVRFGEPLMGNNHGSFKNRNSLRSRYLHGRFLKPLTSLESCLMAQLCDNQGVLLSSLASSPTLPPLRPLVVTNGSRIISHFRDASPGGPKANEEKNLKKKGLAGKTRSVLGVPPLPNIRVPQVPSNPTKGKILRRSSKMLNGKKFHHHEGTLEWDNTMVLCLGIFLGVMVSSTANKKEVDKLEDKLKQSDHLVQDLQEELEMRESMTVKELASENYEESQDTHVNSTQDTLPDHCIDYLVKADHKELYNVDNEANSPDSMTKIEAELEAELERLGLNMKISDMEKRLSNVELDPDLEVNFAQGELREDAFSNQVIAENEVNRDSGSTSTTTHAANYAVSPRELSLRLHEVLQSRLEEQIEELELALQHSQSKLQRSSSSVSKIHGDRNNFSRVDIVQPLVMDLSGEALSAYDEACEELMRFESEEDDSPLDVYEIRNQESSQIAQRGEVNGLEMEFCSNFSKVLGHDTLCEIDYVSSDEEKEKLLIKQIVERTKKGSPVVVNALLSIDEDD